MKPSKLETALSLGGSIFLLVAVFYKPLGLSEAWQWCALGLAPACLIPLIVLQRRRRNARMSSVSEPAPSAPPKNGFWLLLSILVIISLSGPVWLPYTGITLPLSLLIVTAVISCVFSVGIFLLAWRYWRPRA